LIQVKKHFYMLRQISTPFGNSVSLEINEAVLQVKEKTAATRAHAAAVEAQPAGAGVVRSVAVLFAPWSVAVSTVLNILLA
jgi:hypothetical protein